MYIYFVQVCVQVCGQHEVNAFVLFESSCSGPFTLTPCALFRWYKHLKHLSLMDVGYAFLVKLSYAEGR